MCSLPASPVIHEMLRQAFPTRRIAGFEVLSGGLINTNLHIRFENDQSVVLRIYRDGAAACRKELALHDLVKQAVPVASIIYAEPKGVEGSGAFSILEYIDGITFQQLKRTDHRDGVAEAAYSAGRVLAAIGGHEFPKPGRVVVDETSGELMIGEPFLNSNYHIPELVDSFLESPTLQRRISAELSSQLRRCVLKWSSSLSQFEDDRKLVHCDFGSQNLLVNNRSGRWEIAAVLDWELAISGSPLLDVGHFLRYDYEMPLREPHFSKAFAEHGGELPDNWQRIVRVLDLTALVECLTHDKLPREIETEITDLIQATLNQISDTPVR